jgi:hypothetical protein
MNNDQLQQLLGVIRFGRGGGHKTSKFSSAEGTEWQIWRRNFEQTFQINGWANERCQRKAAAAMESTAAEFTSDIPAFVAGRPVQDMLNLYETRFLPAAGGQLAAAQFQTVAQMDGEQIAVWHARLRTIFERAFPGENIQNSRLLINKFVLKLDDSNIRPWTHRANPASYNAAMTAALNEAASQSILAHEAGTGGKGNVAIMHLAPVTGAAVIITISQNVLNIVQTVIATINLEAEVSREGTEAVADMEKDQETQDEMEEDSIECIHR